MMAADLFWNINKKNENRYIRISVDLHLSPLYLFLYVIQRKKDVEEEVKLSNKKKKKKKVM